MEGLHIFLNVSKLWCFKYSSQTVCTISWLIILELCHAPEKNPAVQRRKAGHCWARNRENPPACYFHTLPMNPMAHEVPEYPCNKVPCVYKPIFSMTIAVESALMLGIPADGLVRDRETWRMCEIAASCPRPGREIGRIQVSCHRHCYLDTHRYLSPCRSKPA